MSREVWASDGNAIRSGGESRIERRREVSRCPLQALAFSLSNVYSIRGCAVQITSFLHTQQYHCDD